MHTHYPFSTFQITKFISTSKLHKTKKLREFKKRFHYIICKYFMYFDKLKRIHFPPSSFDVLFIAIAKRYR